MAEGVSNIALVADADRNMVPHIAVSVDTAEARTGVLTLAADARLVRRAVRVHDTLRPAVGWGADHLGEARTLAALSYY